MWNRELGAGGVWSLELCVDSLGCDAHVQHLMVPELMVEGTTNLSVVHVDACVCCLWGLEFQSNHNTMWFSTNQNIQLCALPVQGQKEQQGETEDGTNDIKIEKKWNRWVYRYHDRDQYREDNEECREKKNK